MAVTTKKVTQEITVCDSCGTDIAEQIAVTHISGSATGYYSNDNVEIDLCTDCGEKFGMKRRGRKPGTASNGSSNGSTTARKVRNAGDTDTNAIREWARENGFEVSNRGRLSGEVMDAYRDRNKAQKATAKAATASSKTDDDDPDADWES